MVTLKYKERIVGAVPERVDGNCDCVVYILRCPFSGKIKYIGNTCDPFARFRAHAYCSQRVTRKWTRELQQQQAMFRMEVITPPMSMHAAYKVESLLIDRTHAAYPGQLLNCDRRKRLRAAASP